MDLLDELQARVLCGDGAMGTLLLDAGIPLGRCFEELCVSEPDRIEGIHQQYIAAGARVIETNTFGANAVRLGRFGFEGRVAEINRAGARIAAKAAGGKKVYVAGSVGPLGIGRDEAAARGIDRGHCFREQITALLEGGAKGVFFETFTDDEEMEIAARARREVDDGLTICCFTCNPDGRLASGTRLVDAIAKLHELKVQVVGVNCTNGPSNTVELLKQLSVDQLICAYPNAGSPEHRDGRLIYHEGPASFAKAAREMVAEGARLIGGCCGTNPAHIAEIAAAISNLQPARSI